MSRTILSLILAFGLISCISAVSGAPGAYADDFIKKFAGKYYNSTNTTATPAEDKNATDVADAVADAVADPACAQTLNKTNEAISAFAESVGTAKDKWSLLGSISRLGGQSYSLGFNCKPENLKFINAGEVGVNKTQDEACDKLIEIIQPLLIKGKDDSSSTGGFEKSLGASQQALGISKKLGDKCKVTLIDITAPVEEEEVEVEEEIEEEEEEEEATLEESINEELEEEEESYDLIVQIVDEEGNLETIYYGFPDIDIDLTADENIEQEVEVEEEEESEVEAEEEEEDDVEATLINFVQTKAPENKTNPWADVDYKAKYSSGFTGGNYTSLNAF